MTLVSKGKTGRWLAEQTGIHETTISRIVNGMPPNAEQRKVIAKALGVPQKEIRF